MKKIYATIITSVTLFITLFINQPHANASSLYFSVPDNVSVGEVFSIDVYVSSADRGFNAGEGTIIFPKDIIEVISVDTAPSSTIFNFWLQFPSFSNEKGIVSFSGGTTNGIIGPATQILSIRARAKGIGNALITASDSSINASDGSGTNILEKIDAKYITINKAIVTVPAKPKIVTPVIQKKETVIPQKPPLVVTPDQGRCSIFFTQCDVHFPSINSVSVTKHPNNGFTIFASGLSQDGSHVHLVLKREGVFYKQIETIIRDGKWEGTFDEVFSYGEYSIDATAETSDNRSSEPVTWSGIFLSQPYTLHVFGITLRWYAVVNIFIYILIILFGAFIIRRRILSKVEVTPHTLFFIIGWLLLIAFVAMSFTTYILWKKEKDIAMQTTFWKNTKIHCSKIEQSYTTKLASATLEIFIDKNKQTIPADIGISPQCLAQIHTHDTTGRIHFEKTTKQITLNDFFTVAGIKLERIGYELSVNVNGKDITNTINNYYLVDDDKIIVTYKSLFQQNS